MITAGFDIGTRFFKICLADGARMIASACREAGWDLNAAIHTTYRLLLKEVGVKPRAVGKAIATGYGANMVRPAAYELSEPACIARAVFHVHPAARTVIDVGALFIRIVAIDENGYLDDHLVNEPCAAGSGKFLELAAQALEIPYVQISECARASQHPHIPTSTCAVFAESELISQVNAGVKSEDILAGVVESLTSKVVSLLAKAGANGGSIALAGGVAKVPVFRVRLAQILQTPIVDLPVDPQLVPAYGAALLAQGKILRR